MKDTIGIILSAALILDAASNVLRYVGVFIAMRHQESMIKRQELEDDKRVKAAAGVVESVARETVIAMIGELNGESRNQA